MTVTRFFIRWVGPLLTAVLLAGCAPSDTPDAVTPTAGSNTPGSGRPVGAAGKMYEITFQKVGQTGQAAAEVMSSARYVTPTGLSAPTLGTQALTDVTGPLTFTRLGTDTFDLGGVRHVKALYQVTNNTGQTIEHLTFVPVNTDEDSDPATTASTSPTVDSSYFKSMLTYGGTSADNRALALSAVAGKQLSSSTGAAVADSSATPFTAVDTRLLRPVAPDGLVINGVSASGWRTTAPLAAGASTNVTFAVDLVTDTPESDPYKFSVVVTIADENPPVVRQTTPSGGDVETNVVSVVFSRPMDPATMALQSTPGAYSELSSWSSDFTRAEWKVALSPSTPYTFTVTGQDTAGNDLAGTGNNWSFTTRAPAPANTINAGLFSELGTTAAIVDFLDSTDEAAIRAKLESYGMHYLVLAPGTLNFDSLRLSPLAVTADSDCAPARLPVEGRSSWYNITGVAGTYFVDDLGRPQRAVLKAPPIASGRRSSACQAAVGKLDFASGYDGGHLIADQLGGWGKRVNLVPQNLNFNRGNWLQIENQLARCTTLESGALKYEVSVYYPNDTTNTPSTFSLDISISGAGISRSFENADAGGRDGEANRKAVVGWLKALGCGEVERFNLKLNTGVASSFDEGYPVLEAADYAPPAGVDVAQFFTEDGVEVSSLNTLYCQQERTYTLNYRSVATGKIFARSNDFKMKGRPCRYDFLGVAGATSFDPDARRLVMYATGTVYPQEFPGIQQVTVYRNGTPTSLSFSTSALTQNQSAGESYGGYFDVVGSLYGLQEITIEATDSQGVRRLADFNFGTSGARKTSYKFYNASPGETCPTGMDQCFGGT